MLVIARRRSQWILVCTVMTHARDDAGIDDEDNWISDNVSAVI